MTQVEFHAGDELDGDLEAEGFAGGSDDHADANAVRLWRLRKFLFSEHLHIVY
jgi:hypothetical protein